MSIKESALNTITALTNSDFIRMVTSAGASRKATLQTIAQHIIENYTGSSLAGSNQSVKSALDGLNSKSTLALTRTENEHVSATNFNRLSAVRRGNMLSLFGNLAAAYGSGFSEFIEIGKVNGWSASSDIFVNVPSQDDGSKVLSVAIRANGTIQIFSSTSFAGAPFFRFAATVPTA